MQYLCIDSEEITHTWQKQNKVIFGHGPLFSCRKNILSVIFTELCVTKCKKRKKEKENNLYSEPQVARTWPLIVQPERI